jgi:hypothetical protein
MTAGEIKLYLLNSSLMEYVITKFGICTVTGKSQLNSVTL